MTSQAPRTVYDGCEQRRAPITRPLYHSSHGAAHRHHVNHSLTPTIPSRYDGAPPHDTYLEEPFVVQRAAPTLDWSTALCEEIAATTNAREAVRIVATRISDLVGGAYVEVLPDQAGMAQYDLGPLTTLASLERHAHRADAIDVPLKCGGSRLGFLRVVPHTRGTSTRLDSNELRLVGTALAQALERHRLYAARDGRDAGTAASQMYPERWEEFLGRVAHEVKTPLTCISGHAQLVRRYVRTARDAVTGKLTMESAAHVIDACERHLPALERQVAHIERLMRGMLDLAQVEHGPLSLALERCDFMELLRRAIRDVDSFVHCNLALSVPEHLWLTCDARRVEQALYDVLHYAIRVGGYGGTMYIGVAVHRTNRTRYVMAVIGNRRDPREGDDCAILSRRELRMLRNHRVAGVDQVPAPVALGLALSATICRLHGGDLYSLPPTQGGILVLALPVSGPHAAR